MINLSAFIQHFQSHLLLRNKIQHHLDNMIIMTIVIHKKLQKCFTDTTGHYIFEYSLSQWNPDVIKCTICPMKRKKGACAVWMNDNDSKLPVLYFMDISFLFYCTMWKHIILKLKRRKCALVTREILANFTTWPNVLQWLKHYSDQTLWSSLMRNKQPIFYNAKDDSVSPTVEKLWLW